MGNLINIDGVGKRRERLAKATVVAMRVLITRKKVDHETRDLTAFLVLTIKEIGATIDETCKAWEKRDYWVKADNFRQQWAWTEPIAANLESAVLENKWQLLTQAVPELARHLSTVTPPKRPMQETPWTGAYQQLLEKRTRSQASSRR